MMRRVLWGGAGWCVMAGAGTAPSQMQSGRQSATRPALDWRPCGSLECAELMVPLDPNDPEGQQISIAINRQAATAGGPNRGVLLFNPGGPGEPGKPFVETIGPSLAGMPFDLIGFDPRGVGDSARVDCMQQVNPGAVYVARGVGAAMDALRPEAENCRQAVGPLFDH